MSRVTIKMIADQMGISVSTVNRALTGKGRINEETRRCVLDVASEMGYYPNAQAKALSSKDTLRIAVICDYEMYFEEVIRGLESCRADREDYRLKIVSKWREAMTVEQQRQALLESKEEGVDGVLLAALHPEQLNDTVSDLTACGIPVITFTNDILGGERLTFVGQDGRVAGTMAGELMSRYLGPDARVICLSTNDASLGLSKRKNYFRQELIKYLHSPEQIEFVQVEDIHCLRMTEENIAKHLAEGKTDGIYCVNMNATLAAARVVQQLGLKGQVVVIGHDSSPEINTYIEEGVLWATLFQNPFRQGYLALQLMFEHLYLKKEIDSLMYYIPTVVLMRSNLQEIEDFQLY